MLLDEILLFNLPILVVLYVECYYPIAKMLPNINQNIIAVFLFGDDELMC